MYLNSYRISAGSVKGTGTFEYAFRGGRYRKDINDDNKINLLDPSLLSANYSKTGAALTHPRAGMNGDSTVKVADFSLLSARYGQEFFTKYCFHAAYGIVKKRIDERDKNDEQSKHI